MALHTGPPCVWIRLSRNIIRVAGALVPLGLRNEWRETWEAEVYCRSSELEQRGRLDFGARVDIVFRSFGAFSHAIWLAGREWRVEYMLQDIRYGCRNLVRKPGFAVVAFMTLGLGIGANTVIFSVVDGVILRPFPYPDIDRLVAIGVNFPQLSPREEFIEALSAPELGDIESGARSLEHTLALDLGNRDLGGIDEPQRLFTAFVWSDPFRTIGMKPFVGRGFSTEEIERQDPVAIVSYRVWQQRFGGDPSVVGGPIIINGEPRTLVGVMPPRLLLLDTDLWLPMWAARTELPRSRRQFTILARIKEGFGIEEVDAELDTVAGRVEREYLDEANEYEGWRLGATPIVEAWRKQVGPAGAILLAAVGFVLLIACANIAGLLLARASTRRREMAVRTAVGAGRGRLLRQLFTESSLIALLGGALGVVLAYWGLQYAVALVPIERLPAGMEVALDSYALLYTFGVSVLCGVFFGLAPALQGSRVDLLDTLNADGGRAGTAKRVSSWRRVFVVSEIALSLVLLAGAGLMIRSFDRLQRVDSGVDVDHVLTMRLTLAWERYSEEGMKGFFSRLLQEIEALPGVRAAALASQFPPNVRLGQKFQIAGRAMEGESAVPSAEVTVASPSLFSTLGMALVKGRGLAEQDTMHAPPVAVINSTLARRFFPGEDPIGERVKLGGSDSDAPWRTIVGIVSDTRNHGLDRDVAPELFVSYRQNRWANQLHLLARSEGHAMGLLPSIREVVRSIDPDQPVYAISTLEQSFAAHSASRRVASTVLMALALAGLALASIGIYGVMSYTVNEHAHEIGIRMALGAKGSNLLGWITRQALVLVAVGVVLGLAGAFAATRAMGRLLYQVSPMDPVTMTAAVLVLATVALLASFVPAWRATRLDPVEALRDQ